MRREVKLLRSENFSDYALFAPFVPLTRPLARPPSPLPLPVGEGLEVREFVTQLCRAQ